jgi:hypothetical protein
MDFPYLAKITKLNVAALAAIASAPPPPEPKVEGAVSTDTAVTWPQVPTAAAYKVWWRRTDANQWEVSRKVAGLPNCPPKKVIVASADNILEEYSSCRIALPHIRVDDWVFGVSSESKDGFESPVASAVPGGAFHPYVGPEKK